MMDESLKSHLKTQHSRAVSSTQCSPFFLQKAGMDICYVSPLAPWCWQIALTQSAGIFTAGFGAKWTDKPWFRSAWLSGLELNEITINQYWGWFLTLRSSLQKLLHWQLMLFSLCNHPPICIQCLLPETALSAFQTRSWQGPFPLTVFERIIKCWSLRPPFVLPPFVLKLKSEVLA